MNAIRHLVKIMALDIFSGFSWNKEKQSTLGHVELANKKRTSQRVHTQNLLRCYTTPLFENCDQFNAFLANVSKIWRSQCIHAFAVHIHGIVAQLSFGPRLLLVVDTGSNNGLQQPNLAGNIKYMPRSFWVLMKLCLIMLQKQMHHH